MSNLTVDSVSRDRKFFDEYTYCLKFELQEVTALRTLDHDNINCTLARRSEIVKSVNWGGSWHGWKTITDQTKENCHKLCDYLLSLSKPFKLIVSSDVGHFYTDTFEYIKNFPQLPALKKLQLRQAVVDIPRDCIQLKNSEYNYRTYFKNQFLTDHDFENLQKFFKTNSDCRLGPGFEYWLIKQTSNYVTDNFFVDYNNPGLITMIGLVCSIKIKKTVQIIHK